MLQCSTIPKGSTPLTEKGTDSRRSPAHTIRWVGLFLLCTAPLAFAGESNPTADPRAIELRDRGLALLENE